MVELYSQKTKQVTSSARLCWINERNINQEKDIRTYKKGLLDGIRSANNQVFQPRVVAC